MMVVVIIIMLVVVVLVAISQLTNSLKVELAGRRDTWLARIDLDRAKSGKLNQVSLVAETLAHSK